MKRFTFWLWLAVVFQLLIVAVHSIGLFIPPSPANETEHQLFNLMLNYKQDMWSAPTIPWTIFKVCGLKLTVS